MLLQGRVRYGVLCGFPFCDKMQGIQKTITKAFQIMKGDYIIVQKQAQMVNQLRTSAFKLNTGMLLALLDALFQCLELIR